MAVALAVAIPPAAGAVVPLKLGLHLETATPAEFSRIAVGGADLVRLPVKWGHVQPLPDGPYDWSEYDALIGDAATAGLPVLPVIVGSPRYARPGPAEEPTRAVDRRRFNAFVESLAARYGPGGAFWTEHPEIPPRPVGAWQLWNEPNLSHYWAGSPNAREYVALVRNMRRVILKVQPDAKIVLAGMPEQHSARPASTFLAQMYRVKGFSGLFDVAAVHAYAKRGSGVATVVRRIRGVLDAAGDTGKPIWITELGWGSAGPVGDGRVTTPDGQAQRLSEAFTTLANGAATSKVQRVIWYSWRDPIFVPGGYDAFGLHTGLFDSAGVPKPAWSTFSALAGGTLDMQPLPVPEP
ncbi:MAG: polysaccharide biosynthesis protein PslG [Thermoleophilaceae bacterium]|jgi:hypothetical protein|nr:polysaccharide biosynthesis protein PslG [Thermoleophilaceae bacterium]